jgi:hypothetical protein
MMSDAALAENSVAIDDFDADAVGAMLRFFYTDKHPAATAELLAIAHKYDVGDLLRYWILLDHRGRVLILKIVMKNSNFDQKTAKNTATRGQNSKKCFLQKWSKSSEIVIKLTPGVDVMITIFCDFFDNFRRINWRFSQKPML